MKDLETYSLIITYLSALSNFCDASPMQLYDYEYFIYTVRLRETVLVRLRVLYLNCTTTRDCIGPSYYDCFAEARSQIGLSV
jgi:hypothetical protein